MTDTSFYSSDYQVQSFWYSGWPEYGLGITQIRDSIGQYGFTDGLYWNDDFLGTVYNATASINYIRQLYLRHINYWTYEYDSAYIISHETGHAIGLGHPESYIESILRMGTYSDNYYYEVQYHDTDDIQNYFFN